MKKFTVPGTNAVNKHPHCRVWTASRALMGIMPRSSRVPLYNPDDASEHNGITEDYRKGLGFVLCTTTAWHTDWASMFLYVVVRGSGTLSVSREEGAYFSDTDKPKGPCGRWAIARGSCIALWPLAAHRVTTRTGMSLLEVSRVGFCDENEKKFPTEEEFFTQAKSTIDLSKDSLSTKGRQVR